MTPQFRSQRDYQQDRNDSKRNRPDPETLQQTWGWLRVSNAKTQIVMLEKSHNNRSIVSPDEKEYFEDVINVLKRDLDEIMSMIRSSSTGVEIEVNYPTKSELEDN